MVPIPKLVVVVHLSVIFYSLEMIWPPQKVVMTPHPPTPPPPTAAGVAAFSFVSTTFVSSSRALLVMAAL